MGDSSSAIAITLAGRGRNRTSAWRCAAALLLVAAGSAVYANSFSGVFVFDDLASIVDNPTIRHISNLNQVLSPPRNGETVSERPLLNLSLAVNYALGGANPWGYHLANLVIHILNALLLFGILRRTLSLVDGGPWPVGGDRSGREGEKRGKGASLNGVDDETPPLPHSPTPPLSPRSTVHPLPSTVTAFAITLLWTIHPLQTESVTYVVQRAESLCALFYLLTLYCVIRGAEVSSRQPEVEGAPAPRSAGRRSPSTFWNALAVLACLLGMASKEVMVTAPLVVLVYDRTFLAGSLAQALRRRWPLYLGLAATWVLLGYLVSSTGLLVRRAEFEVADCVSYTRLQPRVILHYLRLSFWPHPLCLDYGGIPKGPAHAILPGAAAVALLLAATVRGLIGGRRWGFLGAWFFLILAPTSSIVPLSVLASDHRMYLPLAAVLTCLVLSVYSIGRWLVHRRFVRAGVAAALGISLLAISATVWGAMTIQRNSIYHSKLDIWQATVATAPDNPFAQNNLPNALAGAGRFAEAIAGYEEALKIAPDYAEAHYNLGAVLARQGRVDAAMAHFEKVLKTHPDYAKAHNNLATALASRGQVDAAVAHYQEALKSAPGYAEAHRNLGALLANQGKLDAAIAHFQQALKIQPDSADAHYNLGNLLLGQGQVDAAIGHFQKVLAIRPEDAKAHNNLAAALARRGQFDAAIALYRQALASPDASERAANHYNLGCVLATSGQLDEAVLQFQKVLETQPDNAAARRNLAATVSARDRLATTLAQQRDALRARPRDVALLNDTAWLLATGPSVSIRNGGEAVALAEKAREISGGKQPAVLGTLAAAYAEAGRFDDAVAAAKEAERLAEAAGNRPLAEQIHTRLELYREHKPYRETAVDPVQQRD